MQSPHLAISVFAIACIAVCTLIYVRNQSEIPAWICNAKCQSYVFDGYKARF